MFTFFAATALLLQQTGFENAQQRATCKNAGRESHLAAKTCSRDILRSSCSMWLSTQCQFFGPRPLLQVLILPPLKDRLYVKSITISLCFLLVCCDACREEKMPL